MLMRIASLAGLTLLLLATPFHAARSEVMWAFIMPEPGDIFTMGAGPVTGAAAPSKLYGHLPVPGHAGEVAVVEAILRPGELVPLPVYSDGTQAREAEIFWTAHLWRVHFPAFTPMNTGPHYEPGDQCIGDFTGRVWNGGYAVIGWESGNTPPDRYSPKSSNLEVLVTVVAVRQDSPTGATSRTWGQLKTTPSARTP